MDLFKIHEEENLNSYTSWEMLKASIWIECGEFSHKKTRKKQRDAYTLENNLKYIAKKCSGNPKDIEQEKHAACKEILEMKQLAKTRGAMAKAKSKMDRRSIFSV